MVNLREVYRKAEEQTTAVVVVLFLLLGGFILLQSLLPPLFILGAILSVGFVILSFYRPLFVLGVLAVYLPFEPVILKFLSDDIFIFARFFSESLIYVLSFVVIVRVLTGKSRLRSTPISLPFGLFVFIVLSSALINLLPPMEALLGMRQIFRFMLVFFIGVMLYPSKEYIKNLTIIMFAVVLFQAALALIQSLIGTPLDQFLLPAQTRTFGDITITSGVVQFWDPGSRVFATLGRYDKLGNFLYFFLLIGVGLLYHPKVKQYRKELMLVFTIGLPALLLTYSRASWFAFLIGFLFIGWYIMRDKRVFSAFIAFLIIVTGYLGISGINVRFITEIPGQTLVERFYETFSFTRWRGEYFGLGRTFWFIQTPMSVVPAAPLFGFGPGQYGGGVVSALRNTRVYDELALPFGVFGTEGFIDNNWFSLWGETGTLGFIFYIWIFTALFVYSVRVYRESSDPFVKSLAIGFAAILLGMAFNAFLSTLFEIRTSAFYLWLYAAFIVVLGDRARIKA